MNVGLSRAKHTLIVVGDINKLRINYRWKGLVDYAKSINRCFRMKEPFE